METFQILSDQFSHFQHLFHRWLAIFCIISSYIFDLSLSPHTWGIRAFHQDAAGSRRFIPTHVGHTCGFPAWHPLRLVHPHTRGAYNRYDMQRMYAGRFIPTHVGHTVSPPLHRKHLPVHPHTRGAYPLRVAFSQWPCGSSPHTWGIHRRWAESARP